jgi:hypothetical protein
MMNVSRGGYEDPRGATEGTLAWMWAQVLNLDLVGRHDDLFEIGGDSLSVLRRDDPVQTASVRFWRCLPRTFFSSWSRRAARKVCCEGAWRRVAG